MRKFNENRTEPKRFWKEMNETLQIGKGKGGTALDKIKKTRRVSLRVTLKLQMLQ